LTFVVVAVAAVLAGRLARRLVLRLMLKRLERTSEGSAYAVARIIQYLVTVVGLFIALENAGVSLSAIAAIGAAFAVGLGFGLQNIAQNFISGLILLLERPVAKGDVVVVGGTFGVVDEISIRATRVMTFDRIAMLVPNSKLISDVVENRSEPTRTYRVRVGVGVAYSSDTREVERVLQDVARSQPKVLDEPSPQVFFTDFGSSSLDFELGVWLDDPEAAWPVMSALRHEISAAFRREQIEIPFPQRDLHLRSGLEANTEASGPLMVGKGVRS
jgi:small-conductance mechanosensitive channel